MEQFARMSQTPPATLGKYQIIREIARSNDIVYEAYDPVMNRTVAVKELAIPGGSTQAQKEDRLRRFLREAKAAGSLTHPNIVTIFEFSEDQGRSFIAMEFLDGRTLRKELENQGKLPRDRALEIARDVLAGLSFAHARGVIHRDIKPENIQLLESGAVKITDFGIARLTFEPNLTMDGQVFGTPSYMSPEQINGKDLDHKSDIFSVGVMLYEMLTGSKPFQGDNVVAIATAITGRELDMPGDIDYPIWQVIETALNKLPQFRYSTAEDMRNAIKQAGSSWTSAPSTTVSAPPPLFGAGQTPAAPYGGQVINQPYGSQPGYGAQPPYGTPPPVAAPVPQAPYGAAPGQVINQPYNPYGASGAPYNPYNPAGQPTNYQPYQPYQPLPGVGGPLPQVPGYYPPPPRRPLISPAAKVFLLRLLLATLVAGTLVGLIILAIQSLVNVAQENQAPQPRVAQGSPAIPSQPGVVAPPFPSAAPGQAPAAQGPTREELVATGQDIARLAASQPIDDVRTTQWQQSQEAFMNAVSADPSRSGQTRAEAVNFYMALASDLASRGENRIARQALQQAEGLAVTDPQLLAAVNQAQATLGV